MKKISILILIILAHMLCFGQKKKSGKTRLSFPKIERPIDPPEAKRIEDLDLVPMAKCFVYKTEERKDSLLFIIENLLEYGLAGDNARMVITSYSYDPAKKAAAKNKGEVLVEEKSMKFVNGSCKIHNDVLVFTPEKLEKFKVRTFGLIYKPKSKKIDYLKDEESNKFVPGDCLEPTVSL
ncbi:hypothetical protein [Sphingobacterium multivorum]|uniref:hypothetical protein n=1 Tax=Sphingobacterium multivorum TaxID=28454 RepID=UPI00345E8F98